MMLPTKEKSNILNDSLGLRYNSIPLDNSLRYNPQHLYIVSDDEIKKDDYFIIVSGLPPLGEEDKKFQVLKHNGGNRYHNEHCKKIIATTDKSLKIKSTCNCSETEAIYCGEEKSVGKCQQSLPSPSEAFIKKYCKLGGIDEVDVEYEGVVQSTTWEHDEPEYWQPKVDSHNNITINPIKDSWSREEVEIKCRQAYQEGKCWGKGYNNTLNEEEWIKKNL